MTKEQAETWLVHPVTQRLLNNIVSERATVIEAQENFQCLTEDAQTTHNNLLRCYTTIQTYDNVLEVIDEIRQTAKAPESTDG